MTRHLILGTAGHIDHGKTSLVRALTGTDTDRLPAEKARGITIDIGFAELTLGDVRFGVVDVPGHERFVRNMLAGSTGIDVALLVVAADDSVMPQTREHLDILTLLGVRAGVIALTKADLADDTTREIAEAEVRELVAGTFLADAPIIPTAVPTGQGIAELRDALTAAAARVAERPAEMPFRLAIDRAFVVQGHGTVVTGTVVSGAAAVGDELDWHTATGPKPVRVRSLSNHGRPADRVTRGMRAGVNLPGVPLDDVSRGQELAAPGFLAGSRRLTVRLHAVSGLSKPLRHRLPVRLHAGTAEVMATLSLLDADQIPPGGRALAQLFLAEPVTAAWGQPFVVRDSSGEHTLGGGRVLQPHPARVRRRQLDALVRVEQLESDDPLSRAEAVAWFAGTGGVRAADWVRDAGVPPDRVAETAAKLAETGRVVELHSARLHVDRVAELERRVLAVLGDLHAANPLMTNHDRAAVLATVAAGDVLPAVVERMLKAKQLVGDTRRLARADFKPKLSVNQRKLRDAIVAEVLAGGVAPPEPAAFANRAGGNAAGLKDIFAVAVAEGLLVKVTDEFYLHADVDADIRRRLAEKLVGSSGLTVAEIRDLLGTTRKYAVPLCEYFDRTGLTRRVGDVRVANEAMGRG